MDVDELVGTFVVEIGVRQAWPFLGFCDSRGASIKETRLYLDAAWSIDGSPSRSASETQQWLAAADGLGGLTVSVASVGCSGALRLALFGDTSFRISGEATSNTSGEPWWFAPWFH